MELKRFLEIDIATGRYLGEWVGPDGEFTPPDGHQFIKKAPDFPRPAAGSTWNGTAFVAPAPVVSRRISRGAFMDRFSMPTQLALEQIAEGQTAAGRVVRVFMRRLEAEESVNLDSPAIAAGLLQLKPALIAGAVPGWEDNAAATATIATILA